MFCVGSRCIEQLLSSHQNIELWASYLQIYCEEITDLLSPPDPFSLPSSSSKNDYYETTKLQIRDKVDGNGVYVEGLSKIRVSSLDDLWDVLSKGDQNRTTAVTNLNEQSSRSHAALIISVLIPEEDSPLDNPADNMKSGLSKRYKEGKLLLVDLAGSERAKASEGRDFMRLEEAKAINLSLSSLGNCMNALAEGKSFIPYRDSKLTRLLTNCLGGTSRTSLIVNLVPDNDVTSETLNALRFAARASKVKVNAKISKVQNYELLYKDLLNKMSNNTSSMENTYKGDRSKDYEQLLTEKQSRLDEKDVEITFLKEQLRSMETENSLLLKGAKGSLTTPRLGNQISACKTDNPSDDTEVNQLKLQLETLTKEHMNSLQSQHSLYQKKLNEKDLQIQRLSREQHGLQENLYLEKENHFKTIQDLKKIHESYHLNEKNFQTRLEECLNSLNTMRNDLENKETFTQSLQEEKKSLALKVIEYEQTMHRMVSYEQVKEMEMLFMETITKLAERVQTLESQRGPASSLSNNSGKMQGNSMSIVGKGPANYGSSAAPSGKPSNPKNNPALYQQGQQAGILPGNKPYQFWTPTSSTSNLVNSEMLLSSTLFQSNENNNTQIRSNNSTSIADMGGDDLPEESSAPANNKPSSAERFVRLEPGKIRAGHSSNNTNSNTSSNGSLKNS
jgi:kinesin family protein 5